MRPNISRKHLMILLVILIVMAAGAALASMAVPPEASGPIWRPFLHGAPS